MTPTPSTGGDARADLLKRLKAATGADREIDRDLGCVLLSWTRITLGGLAQETDAWLRDTNGSMWRDALDGGFPTYTASLDAALALVERVLPGWHLQLFQDDDGWLVRLLCRSPYKLVATDDQHRPPTAPLAVLIALLSALPPDSLGQEETGK